MSVVVGQWSGMREDQGEKGGATSCFLQSHYPPRQGTRASHGIWRPTAVLRTWGAGGHGLPPRALPSGYSAPATPRSMCLHSKFQMHRDNDLVSFSPVPSSGPVHSDQWGRAARCRHVYLGLFPVKRNLWGVRQPPQIVSVHVVGSASLVRRPHLNHPLEF